jgi:LysM repeat protein
MKKSESHNRLVTLSLTLIACILLFGVGISSILTKRDSLTLTSESPKEDDLSLVVLNEDSILLKKLKEQNQQYEEQIAFLLGVLEENAAQIQSASQPAEEIPLVPEPVTHKVTKGETLSSISQKYYGTTKRWNEIYEANKGHIPNKNSIKQGLVLIIPE